jgi:DNA-binding PadR family transcriptional regulator
VSAVSNAPEIRLGDVSAFQRDLLTAIGLIEQNDETPTTSGMIDVLDPYYSESITRGRLSRNLDDLSRRDMIEVEPVDGRTNAYFITAAGREMLRTSVELRLGALDDVDTSGRDA